MIRKVTVQDIDALKPLYIACFQMHHTHRSDIFPSVDEKTLTNALEEELQTNKLFYVYEKENVIVAYIAFQFVQKRVKTLWIDELYVLETYRRQGIAKQLLDYTTTQAKENTCERVEFCAWNFNADAMHVYEKLGYSIQRTIYELKL